MVDAKLEELMRQLGATDEQLAAHNSDGARIRLAGDLVLRRGHTMSVEDVAIQCGVGRDVVRHLYGMMGVSLGDGAVVGEADVALVEMAVNSGGGPFVQSAVEQILRVAGASLSRLAEAAVAAYVQDVGRGLTQSQATAMERASSNAQASQLALDLGTHLGTIFAHHMRGAIDRQRHSVVDIDERSQVRLAVGFVDLVGFTPLARALGVIELAQMIDRFEMTAFDCASGHGGRLVKSIGDEVMFVAEDALAACAIALDLVARFEGDDRIDPRGGVCAGDVLFRLGDYYGPVVNLASRLADEAVPGEVLTDESVTGIVGVALEPGGRRKLKGFDTPIPVWTLMSADR